jgi:hypothetical protein
MLNLSHEFCQLEVENNMRKGYVDCASSSALHRVITFGMLFLFFFTVLVCNEEQIFGVY